MTPAGKFEHLASYSATLTKLIDYGNTVVGPRIDAHFEGPLTGEKLSGHMEGIDYIRIRANGTIEITVRATIKTDDGVDIGVTIDGYASTQDGSIRDTSVRMFTGDEKYAWLSEKIIIGWGQVAAVEEGGTFTVDYYYES